jgi:apolipoprotein N-acyltransferase
VYLIGADGALRARYDKQYLLPFMETFPVGVDLLRRRFGRLREFAVGEPSAPLPTRAGAAGVLVCNEAMLPHVAAARVAEGAELLVNPSNDSWGDDPGFARHLFDMAALRAVEQRRFLVRASDAGVSGVIDPYGRTLAASEPRSRAVVSAAVAPVAERSVYGHVGDLFAVGCAAAVLARLAWVRWRRPAERAGSARRD